MGAPEWVRPSALRKLKLKLALVSSMKGWTKLQGIRAAASHWRGQSSKQENSRQKQNTQWDVMKIILITKGTLLSLLAVSLAATINSARAGSIDHYTPGVFNIRDYFLPAEPGFYGGVYNYYYHSEQFNDANGNKLNSVTISPGPGPGVTLNIKPRIDQYALAPLLAWAAPCNFYGIKYGAYIS